LRELHDALLRVSDPASPDYGRHLSQKDVNRLTAPAPEHTKAVVAFLQSYGLDPRPATPNGDMLAVVAPVEVAERLLATSYTELEHTSGVALLRALGGYSLPPAVAAAVDFVAPVTHIPRVRRPVAAPRGAPNASALGYNTPKNLRKLYGVDVEGVAADNRQAVTAFLEQGYTTGSLHAFWKLWCRGISCGKGDPTLVGDAVKGSPGVESMLDIETITGVAGNVSSEFWGFAGRSPDNPQNEPFLKWLGQLSSTSDDAVPKVFSTSYGEDEGSWSYPAAQRLNVEFQKAGVRGISLLFASGDSGANCKSGRFVPQGPASSPYVTAVGGTQPSGSWPSPGSETAIGLSSGGFSNYWPMPSWQRDAVAKYLSQGGIPEQQRRGFNVSGRAFPDISAQATNFFVFAGMPVPGVAGTSCASPAAAGIFALLNDLRLSQGKPPLGFLNPFIYANAHAFNDITQGQGEGCSVLGDGWPAKAGWDAVTGVGTPNYAELAKVVSSLPAGLPQIVV